MPNARITQVTLPAQSTAAQVREALGQISKQVFDQAENTRRELAERVRSIGITTQVDLRLDDVRQANVVICDASTRPIRVILPAIENCVNRWCYVKKLDSTANAIIVTPRTGDIEQLAGGFGPELTWTTARAAYQLFCDGTHWYIV